MDGKTWIHILNYQYDEKEDRITPFDHLELVVRNVSGQRPEIMVPQGDEVPDCEITETEDGILITLKNTGLYTIIAFR